MLNHLKQPTMAKDGITVVNYNCITKPSFRNKQATVYASFTAARNAKNKLPRAIRWGIFAQNQFTWLNRPFYSLPKALNKEEGGNMRELDLIPKIFLKMSEVESILLDVFKQWHFSEGSDVRAYEVQVSAIRYRATLTEPAIPAPVHPHQDLVDTAIVLMNKTDNILGGVTRIFDLNEQPLYEIDLQPGQALFVNDSDYLHQVTPILLDSKGWSAGVEAFRDILIVRFQPVGR